MNISYIFLFTTLNYSSHAFGEQDKKFILSDSGSCSFYKNQIYYKIENAKNDARRSFSEKIIYIYGVANSITPEYIGIENLKTICPGYEIVLDKRALWVGADSNYCKDNARIEKFAFDYSKIFNHEMVKLITENNMFQCKQ